MINVAKYGSAEILIMLFLSFFVGFGLGFFFKSKERLRDLVYDDEKRSVRGSFINFMFTVMIAILIAIGAFRQSVSENLMRMETLIIGVFAASFGIYTVKQGYQAYLNTKNGK